MSAINSGLLLLYYKLWLWNSSAYMIDASSLALTHDSQLQVSTSKSHQSHLAVGEFPGWVDFRATVSPKLALRVIHCSGMNLEDQPVYVESIQHPG